MEEEILSWTILNVLTLCILMNSTIWFDTMGF